MRGERMPGARRTVCQWLSGQRRRLRGGRLIIRLDHKRARAVLPEGPDQPIGVVCADAGIPRDRLSRVPLGQQAVQERADYAVRIPLAS